MTIRWRLDSCYGRLELRLFTVMSSSVVSCQLVRLPGSVSRQLPFLGRTGRVPATGRANITHYLSARDYALP